MVKEYQSECYLLLQWLDEQERVAHAILRGIDYKEKRYVHFDCFPVARFPRATTFPSDKTVKNLLGGIAEFRAAVQNYLASPPHIHRSVQDAAFYQAIVVAMALSSGYTEAILLLGLGDTWAKGYDLEERQKKASATSVERRKAVAKAKHSKWRALANQYWLEKPELRVSACSRKIIKNLNIKDSPKRVSDVIRDCDPRPKRSKRKG